MRKFLSIVGAFVAFLYAVLALSQFIFDKYAKKSETVTPYKNINKAFSENVDADLLILGNSRAEYHYNTEIMNSRLPVKCYNLGFSGRSFDYQYNLVLIPYLARNRYPDIIVQDIGPQAFYEHWNQSFDYGLLPYLNESEFDFYISDCEELTCFDKHLPVKYRGRSLLNHFRDFVSFLNDTSYRYDCYTPGFRSSYLDNFQRESYPLESNKEIVKLFRDFVVQCNDNDIKLVLVCSPMHLDDFASHCDMFGFWRQVDSITQSFNVYKLDYSDMFGNDTSYFMEATHLNGFGADIFTSRLVHDLDSMGIIDAK